MALQSPLAGLAALASFASVGSDAVLLPSSGSATSGDAWGGGPNFTKKKQKSPEVQRRRKAAKTARKSRRRNR